LRETCYRSGFSAPPPHDSTAVAVTDREMIDGMLAIGKAEGVSAAPEGGAAYAALQCLVHGGTIDSPVTAAPSCVARVTL
jgi:threonine synthase